ncbi:MAG: hypothetical protein GX221_05160 [Candidatus Riflebacteria bacterium]|nr:hypothetical protein [Candidatus Riflebacteria bacterium]
MYEAKKQKQHSKFLLFLLLLLPLAAINIAFFAYNKLTYQKNKINYDNYSRSLLKDFSEKADFKQYLIRLVTNFSREISEIAASDKTTEKKLEEIVATRDRLFPSALYNHSYTYFYIDENNKFNSKIIA